MKPALSTLARLLACVALFSVAMPSFAEKDIPSFKDAVAAAVTASMKALAEKDAATIGSFYADDAWMMPANAAIVKGKVAITAAWKAWLDAGTIDGLKFWAVRVESSGHHGTEMGEYSVTNKDGVVVDNGKYLAVWRHSADGWKIVADCSNSSNPLPATQ